MKSALYLAIAIITEVIGTTALKASDGFSRITPFLIVIISYTLSFYLLSLSLRSIPLGIGYAIWAGVGTALTMIVSIIIWKEEMSVIDISGILCIVFGVILLNFDQLSMSHE